MALAPKGPRDIDPRLVGALVDELCALDCVRDPEQCIHFVALVAFQLRADINYARKTPRVDMLSLVMDVLKRDGGLDALIFGVSVASGPEDSARLARLVGSSYPAETTADLAPVFSDSALREIGRLLGEVRDADDGRLHTVLGRELGIDVPYGLSPMQRFDYLREVNTQADGLPPALVLVEVIAHQSKPVGDKLREWSDRWAREAGADAVEALAVRRQGIASPSGADPEVPRALVVMVEPADDGSADVFVRHWVNPAPGYWEPVAGDVERTTLDTLAVAVDRAIGSGEAHWADVPELENEPPVQVEFVLPYPLLNHDMARLELGTESFDPLPIGLRYHIHLRSLERMRNRDPAQLRRWRARWKRLKTAGAAEPHRWRSGENAQLDRWRATLASEPRLTAVILDVPALPGHGLEALTAAIAEGVGLAAWDRRSDSPAQSGEVLTVLLGHNPAQLPSKVRQLRKGAEELDGGSLLLGRHIAFFWDDPNRLVDCEEELSA
ncbi:hypothetical protein [Streptomyces sp. BE147]|uniref:VMAP-C domain-containing protein n=1 Tax=unclassified Streptomyces TaxID=2593676 RepID=UPI002E771846|nr:hypothetical protein [Streptomyces sp. BE147]MEE1742157.1 hypothetical protein [Streptomyces sp. BE147]